jgi:hypothetical protein
LSSLEEASISIGTSLVGSFAADIYENSVGWALKRLMEYRQVQGVRLIWIANEGMPSEDCYEAIQ